MALPREQRNRICCRFRGYGCAPLFEIGSIALQAAGSPFVILTVTVFVLRLARGLLRHRRPVVPIDVSRLVRREGSCEVRFRRCVGTPLRRSVWSDRQDTGPTG